MSNTSGLLGFIIFIIICVLSSAGNKKKKGGAKTTPAKPAAPKPSAAPKTERPVFTPKAPTVKTATQERKYYDSTCMTASSEHDHNRRLEQLRDFLKDGIIDREEYNILLERYEQYR